MFNAIVIPQTLTKQGENYFSHQMILRGQKILENGRVAISFSRERTKRYTLSGIVTDNDPFQVRLTLDENGEPTLRGNCNCQHWNEEKQCQHVAALYLHYNLNKLNTDEANKSTDLKSHIHFHGTSVHVNEYGRIEMGASKLVGANSNSTYSSLQYMLTSRKTKNFPLPKNLEGKLVINFVKASGIEEFASYNNIKHKYYPLFSILDSEGNEQKKISLFEHLYIFDWTTGAAYNLPASVSHLVKKFMNTGLLNNINTHLKEIQTLLDTPHLQIKVDDKAFNEIETFRTNTRFSISTAKRKGFLDFTLSQPKLIRGEINLIELRGVFTYGSIAALLHVSQDRSDCGVNIGGHRRPPEQLLEVRREAIVLVVDDFHYANICTVRFTTTEETANSSPNKGHLSI